MPRYAVVVDPLGSGQDYPEAFRAAGVETVAVLSAEPAQALRSTWHPENFRQVHLFDGDLTALAKSLQADDVVCVIAGNEIGVELSDALVELVLPGTGNVPALTAARRDKCAMSEAVRQAGVPHLRQVCGADPDEIERWLDETGLQGRRLVVKPPKSAGTDDVHIVPAGADWRPLFDQIHGRTNKMGVRNDAVLVQEFAEGTEYLIDSYSVDGVHALVDVCRYTKLRRGDRIGIYDLVDFLPPDQAPVPAIWAYTKQVLDAVGIRNGCGHTEVIVTAEGPRLVEVAARQAGGGHQMITKLATGTNHILRTVEHRVNGRFLGDYRLVQSVCSVVISAPRSGIWRNAEIFSGVESLATYHAKWFAAGTGDPVPQTEDIYTYLGWVVLCGPDAETVAADYRRIKDIEREIQIDPGEQPVPAGSER